MALRPVADQARRVQSLPTRDPQILTETHRWNSEPANSSDAINHPSQLSPLPESPESPHPHVDLETGSEVPIVKKHWWSRSSEPRQHSPLTESAHNKSAIAILKEIIFSSWVNLLLVFIPVGIALHFVNVNPTIVFVTNFLAIVPLAGVYSLLFFR